MDLKTTCAPDRSAEEMNLIGRLLSFILLVAPPPVLEPPAASSLSRRDPPCLEVGGVWGEGGVGLASPLALLHLGRRADPRRPSPGLAGPRRVGLSFSSDDNDICRGRPLLAQCNYAGLLPMIRPIGNRWAIRAAHQALLLSPLASPPPPHPLPPPSDLICCRRSFVAFFFPPPFVFFAMAFVIEEIAYKYSYELQKFKKAKSL